MYEHVNVHNFTPDGGTYMPDIWLQNWGGPNLAAVFSRSILTNADLFAYGMLAAILFVAIEQAVIGGERAAKWIHRAAILGIPVFGVLTLKLVKDLSPFGYGVLGIVSALFIVMVILPLAWGAHPDWRGGSMPGRSISSG